MCRRPDMPDSNNASGYSTEACCKLSRRRQALFAAHAVEQHQCVVVAPHLALTQCWPTNKRNARIAFRFGLTASAWTRRGGGTACRRACTRSITPVTAALAIFSEFPRNADDSLTTSRIAGANVRRMTSTQTIGVIGAGTMGTGIAQACVVAGLSVGMIDLDEERVTRGREAIANGLGRMLKKAKLSAADRNAALGRVRGTANYEALSSFFFNVEAATENGALELQILRQIGDVAADTERPPQLPRYDPCPRLLKTSR